MHVNAQPPGALLQSLSSKGWKRAYVDGGQLIQSFVKAGLIEDLIITRIPILLGSGRPLFGPLSTRFGSTTSRPRCFLLVWSSRRIKFDPVLKPSLVRKWSFVV